MTRFGVLTACILCGLWIASCGGKGGVTTTGLVDTGTTVETPGPVTMPAFPVDELPNDLPRLVAGMDNIQLGKDAARISEVGANLNGDDLDLDTDAGSVAWGIWRWGAFSEGVLPETLRIYTAPVSGGEYWLLISNYDTGYWDIYGPFTDTLRAFAYETNVDYISDYGYTYAALVAEGGNDVSIEQLNLVCEEDVNPPLAPRDLEITDTSTTSVDLAWTANTDADLHRYLIYTGPTEDFDIDTEGENVGQTGSAETTFTVEDLEPDTTYHFQITALDYAANESSPSNTATGDTLGSGDYPPPTDLVISNVTGTKASVSWTDAAHPDVIGYEVYSGPTASFNIGDTGVVKHNISPTNTKPFEMTGFLASTDYFCRMRAYYGPGTYSNLSEAEPFTTTASSPPEPDFNYSPSPVQVGVLTYFNPSGTQDDDTDPEDLVFMWDWENDGTVDETTQGPEPMPHTFDARGPVTVKLTVSDGTPVSITKDIIVTFRQDYEFIGVSPGDSGMVVAADADPATGRRVALVLYKNTSLPYIAYDNGSGTWQSLNMDVVSANGYMDVALTANGVALLVAQLGTTYSWVIYTWEDGFWTFLTKQSVGEVVIVQGDLAVAPNGRYGVSLILAYPAGNDSDNRISSWHEKADGNWTSDERSGYAVNVWQPATIERSNNESYVFYCMSGNLRQVLLNDSGASQSTLQTYTGDVTTINSDIDPSDPTHAYYTFSTSSNRVYYGDNYGTANGSTQYYSCSTSPTAVAGVGLVGDNEGLFCWTDQDGQHVQTLNCYDTTANAGSGALYEINSGVGMAAFGNFKAYGSAGAYFPDGATPGVFSVVSEERDGDCTGYHISGGSSAGAESLYEPTNEAGVGSSYEVLAFADGSYRVLGEQAFPSAKSVRAAYAGDTTIFEEVGEDNWIVPHAACITPVAGEYFVGSSLADFGADSFLLTRFEGNNETGTVEADLAGVDVPVLFYHRGNSGVKLFSLSNTKQNIVSWTWNGSAWVSDGIIYSGSLTIGAYTVAEASPTEWGICFADAGDNLRLMETSGGVWQAPLVISTDAVNTNSGIGFSYHDDGHIAVLVKRTGADKQIYMGIKLNSESSFTWESVFDPGSSNCKNLYAFYQFESPVALFQYCEGTFASQWKMWVAEKADDEWETVKLSQQMHGAPIAACVDTGNNIILAGYQVNSTMQNAVMTILYY
ncbi:fibronectin type III domain-containing protein [bacterium]|nr:fibronectin type III domain-containing protein [bacterium]